MRHQLIRTSAVAIVAVIGVFSIMGSNGDPPDMQLKPAHYCATSDIHVAWANAPDGTMIKSDPAVFQPFPAEPANDEVDVKITDVAAIPQHPPRLIKVIMDIPPEGDENNISRDVGIVPEGETELLSIVFTPDCSSGTPSWTQAEFADTWDDNLRVRTVLNKSDRDITLTHSPVMEPIAKSAATTAFDQLPVSGNWSATAKLKQPSVTDPMGRYEACTDIQGTTGTVYYGERLEPPTLTVDIHYGCKN